MQTLIQSIQDGGPGSCVWNSSQVILLWVLDPTLKRKGLEHTQSSPSSWLPAVTCSSLMGGCQQRPIHLIPCPPGPLPAPHKNEQHTQKSQAKLSTAPSLLGCSHETATRHPRLSPGLREVLGALWLRERPMCFGCLSFPGSEWPSGGALREAEGREGEVRFL